MSTQESLTYSDGKTRTKIVEVMFTFALDGGMWLRDEYGAKDYLSFENIIKRYGRDVYEKWFKIAYAGGWCGMWYDADDGKLSASKTGHMATY